MKGDLKTVLLVAAGVFVAGLAMAYASDVGIVSKARDGFGG